MVFVINTNIVFQINNIKNVSFIFLWFIYEFNIDFKIYSIDDDIKQITLKFFKMGTQQL